MDVQSIYKFSSGNCPLDQRFFILPLETFFSDSFVIRTAMTFGVVPSELRKELDRSIRSRGFANEVSSGIGSAAVVASIEGSDLVFRLFCKELR